MRGYSFQQSVFSRQVSAVSNAISMTADDSNPIRQSITDALGADIVSDGSAADAIDGVLPDVVVSPGNVYELSRLLALANREGLAVAPRGGGTQLALGNQLGRLDIVIDMSRLNQVVRHNAADLTLVVEAGITLAALRETLAAEGQFLPLDAPLPQRATIGGTLAAGVSGPLKWQYGSARDLVIGMKVAQADGRLTQSGGQVVKNVSGYDMARLHVGGLGTLGIITEVSFKLTPLPRHETTLVAWFNSAAECLDAALSIFNSDIMPLAMTVFDGGVGERIGLNGAGDGGVGERVGLNGAGEDGCLLAVRLGGRPRTLQRLEDETLAIIRAQATRVDKPDDDTSALWAHLADFGHGDNGEAVMSARIAVVPNRIVKVAEALAQSGSLATVSHPGYGMMGAHWFDADMNLGDSLRDARDAVHSVGGSLIVERAPLSVKAHFDMWDYNGESLEVMRRLKAQYDPNGILNPNRFAGGI